MHGLQQECRRPRSPQPSKFREDGESVTQATPDQAGRWRLGASERCPWCFWCHSVLIVALWLSSPEKKDEVRRSMHIRLRVITERAERNISSA